MSRVTRVNPLESAAARRELLERAFRGELHWSDAARQMRLSLGKSQNDFGRMFGLTRRQVMEIETGKGNPTVETLNRIAKPFGLAVGFVAKVEMKPRGGAS